MNPWLRLSICLATCLTASPGVDPGLHACESECGEEGGERQQGVQEAELLVGRGAQAQCVHQTDSAQHAQDGQRGPDVERARGKRRKNDQLTASYTQSGYVGVRCFNPYLPIGPLITPRTRTLQ